MSHPALAVVSFWYVPQFTEQHKWHTYTLRLYLFQTTASDSALTAVIAARSRYTRAHPDVPLNSLVIYGTSQTHSLGAKAALVLGLQFRAIEVFAENGYALRGDSLISAMEEDRKVGRHPFVISECLAPLLCLCCVSFIAIEILLFLLLLSSRDCGYNVLGSDR